MKTDVSRRFTDLILLGENVIPVLAKVVCNSEQVDSHGTGHITVCLSLCVCGGFSAVQEKEEVPSDLMIKTNLLERNPEQSE